MDPLRATEEFYDWELRGRGWRVWDYPVALEPPFRPFFFHGASTHLSVAVDDGRYETTISRAFGRLKRFFRPSGAADVPLTPQELSEPAPAPGTPSDHEYVLLAPRDFTPPRDVTDRLLVALSSVHGPLAFEVIGAGDCIRTQFVCGDPDRAVLRSHLTAYMPEIALAEPTETLADTWSERGGESFVVDFGLSNEFMLPIRVLEHSEVDPLIAVVAALSELAPDELGVLQVLFEEARHPWAESIARAVSDGAGKCFFVDAPEVLPLSREKTSAPLFAVAVRVAARAGDRERATEIARGVGAALLQLRRPQSNELVPLTADGLPEKLHIGALLERCSYRSGMILSLAELRSLVHVPDASVRSGRFQRLETRTKAAPAEATGHSLALGENLHRGKRELISLSFEQRLKHIHIIGASGTGKSTLLVSMILQAIAAGEGIGVLDPHGDLIDEILGRIPEDCPADIVVFDPADPEYSVGLNILHGTSEVEREILASDLVAIFRRLASTSWGDQMTAILGNAISAFLEHPEGGTLADLHRFLVDAEYRRRFLADVADPEVRRFWVDTFPLLSGRPLAPILTRLNAFLRPRPLRGVVSQRKGCLDLSPVVGEGKVFLAKLSQGQIGVENSHFLGSLLVTKFHQVALARQALHPTERRPFFLFVDEFQHFATPSMASVLSGARKFGLGLVLAHQELGQLAEVPEVRSSLLGNAYTRIVFRVGDEDARSLAGGFSFFDAEDLASLPTGEAICRVGQARQDFSLSTYPLSAVAPEARASRRARVVARSRAQYGQRRSEALEEVAAEDRGRGAVGALPRAPAGHLLLPGQEPRVAPSARTAEPAMPGRGGKEHKYLQHLLRQLAEQRGFRVALEEELSDQSGRIDVVLRRENLAVACEVSVTTTGGQEVENVRKCLRAGFEQIVVIASDERRLRTLSKAIADALPPNEAGRIEYVSAAAIVDYLDHQAPPQAETIRGYSVRVTRRPVTHGEAEARREAIGRVIARSISKDK